MTEDFCLPFALLPHTGGALGVGCYRWVVRLKQNVKEVEGDSGVVFFAFGLGEDKYRGIDAPWEFYGLEEVAEILAERFKVFVGRFSSDGREFIRPVIEEGGDLLDSGISGNVRGRLGQRRVGQCLALCRAVIMRRCLSISRRAVLVRSSWEVIVWCLSGGVCWGFWNA